MLSGDLGNLTGVIVLELVDVTNNFALVGMNGSQQEQILQVTVITKR
jgi:hypothetical protein